jgi:chlorobactene glucosyltransferase
MTLLIVTLSNLRYLRRLQSYALPKIWPRFSVLVPARNEEQSIAACVSGLLAQDYPNFQLIVLDDNSTDGTWDILQEFAIKDSRLQLMKGQALPSDWLGKHWACHQMAQVAEGEMLLFVDADTIHQPNMLRCAAAAMIGEDAALISALPRQHVNTWSEMLSIPAFYLGMLCGVPMRLTRLQRNPLLFACLGQFLLFRREAYDASGGYAAVRQNIVDDLAIGRRIHAMGLRYRLLDGNGQVSCRMYHNFDQVWKGLTKSTFATFNFDPVFLVTIWLLVLMIFVEPLVMLIISFALPQIPFAVTAAAGLAVLLALLLWAVSNFRFHFPGYLVLTYPVSTILMATIALASMVLTMQGKALWKGRLMPKTVKL